MRKNFFMASSKIIFASAGLALALAIPVQVWAFGQMSQPIKIDNAMRGQQISQELIIVNSDNRQITASLSAEGQIKDWIKFYKLGDLKNPITSDTIPARVNLNMIAVISIPKDVPNGQYSGVISATNGAEVKKIEDKTSASVSQKIDRQVTITISDKEEVKLAVSVIPETYDLRSGQPLKVRIIYDNQSNVSLSPQINLKLMQGDKTLSNVIYPYPEDEAPVNSMGMYEIKPLQINTLGLAKGQYLAKFQFMHGDKVIAEKQFGFSHGSSKVVLGIKIGDFLSGPGIWFSAITLLAVLSFIAWRLKSNSKSKNKTIKFKEVKKKLVKRFKLAFNNLTSLF